MRLHARTIRLRLTLIYGVVFLLTGTLLLTIGYLLVRHNLHERHTLHQDALRKAVRQFNGPPFNAPRTNNELRAAAAAGYAQAATSALHRLLAEYIAALAAMTGVSVAAGWLITGRALAPLRAITATAQRVSSENLGERIALQGPSDELRQLADTFDGMLERLDGAFESQRHFVANASHELRTPLAIMRTEVDVALADSDASADDLRAMGEALRETIDRSEALIAALLTLARSETISGREEAVDLAALAGDCITDLLARSQGAGVTVHDDLQPAAIRGDSALLERMVGNLVENGIRHNVNGGELNVRTRTDGTNTMLVVSNSGAVITQEQADTLTEPFRRLSRTPGGFGLGLSIVRSVATAHRGSVRVIALAQGGLEVRVTLPGTANARNQVKGRRQRSLTKS